VTQTPTSSVLGRRGELDEIETFLDSVAAGDSRVLLLSGQAGIGKATLWSAGVCHGSSR
jgi:predicted ATPase